MPLRDDQALFDALQIVLDLARQNVCPDDDELQDEQECQLEALALVEQFASSLS